MSDSPATPASAASLPQSAFGTPKRYQTLRARWRARKPSRAPGFRSVPVLLRLDPAAGVTPSDRPPVRIFLGTEPEQFRAERVFVWSVLQVRDPARTYEIYLMKDLAGYDRRRWTTGFTNYRYAIPAMAGGAGRAIYNDVDQIYLGDPAALFDDDMGGAALLAINQQETSVMLMDCAQLAPLWQVEEVQRRHEHRHYRSLVLDRGAWGVMLGIWNARDFEYRAGESQLLHYTTLYKQPWQPFPEEYRYQPNELAYLWQDLERQADEAGFTCFTAQRPSPAFLEMKQQGLQLSAHLPPEQLAWHLKQLRRLSAKSPASPFGLAELGDSGLRQVLPAGLRMSSLPLVGETLADAGATASVAIGQLEQLPEDDIPWVLDRLFSSARDFVYVAVTAYDAAAAAAQTPQTRLPPKWWHGQLEAAARRHPGKTWRLAMRLAAAERSPSAWRLSPAKRA